MTTPIRKAQAADLEGLKGVIDSSELFPSELLDDMIAGYFEDPESEEIWLTWDEGDGLAAVAYCAPEKMTDGTFNLYLIAIHSDHQSKGIGAEMMIFVENLLKEQGERILIVETSGLPEFESTRRFYERCDYQQEAIIRDFYEEGDDKVVFWKKLVQSGQERPAVNGLTELN